MEPVLALGLVLLGVAVLGFALGTSPLAELAWPLLLVGTGITVWRSRRADREV